MAIYNSEDEINYIVSALTKKQTKLKEFPKDAFSIEASTYEEAKGVAKGILSANKKYVYACVFKITFGYVSDEWQMKNAELIYDTWYEEDDEDQVDISTLS